MDLQIDQDDEFIPQPIKFDRRRELRNTTAVWVTMTILNGPGAGSTHQLVSRDSSFTGVSFTIDQPLTLGQSCTLYLQNPDQTIARFVAQVIRSRATGQGQYEVALRFQRQIAA
jgi:hypothetical protein